MSTCKHVRPDALARIPGPIRSLCRLNRALWIALAGTSILLLLACGGSSPSQPQYKYVSITSVSPIPTVNGPAFTMTVTGSNFLPGSNLFFVVGPPGNWTPTQVSDTQFVVDFRADTFPSATQYRFQIWSPITPCVNQYCSNQYSNIFLIDLTGGQ